MHSVPAGSESHFKVVIVSSQFSNVNLVQVIVTAIDDVVEKYTGTRVQLYGVCVL
jgi:stress-induced morphogen